MAQIATWTQKREPGQGILALRSGALTPKMVLLFLLAVSLVAAVAVLIVWTRNQVVESGYQLSQSAQRLAVLQTENRALLGQRGRYLSMERLSQKAVQFGLSEPTPDQVIVFYE